MITALADSNDLHRLLIALVTLLMSAFRLLIRPILALLFAALCATQSPIIALLSGHLLCILLPNTGFDEMLIF